MEQGRGGIGSKKHGTSGKTSKSPKLRANMKRDAEKSERKRKNGGCKFSSIKELVRG